VVGIVAVHIFEQLSIVRRAQRLLDFACKRERRFDRPVGQQSGVDECVIIESMHQLPVTQPVDQLLAIGCVEHLLQCVVLAQLGATCSDGDEMQIVITEHAYRALAELPNEAQRLQ